MYLVSDNIHFSKIFETFQTQYPGKEENNALPFEIIHTTITSIVPDMEISAFVPSVVVSIGSR